jgi:hypothetical protein
VSYSPEIEKKYSKENPVERSDMHVNNGCLDDSAVSMATSGISIATPIPDSNSLERMQLEIDKLVGERKKNRRNMVLCDHTLYLTEVAFFF